MSPAVFWFQQPSAWPALVVLLSATSLVGLTGLMMVQLRRQVRAAWDETGRIHERSTARLDAVGDLLDDILFETDATRTLVYTNRAFHRLTGYRDRDLHSGLGLADLFDPAERARLLDGLDPARPADADPGTYHLRCRDGSQVPVTVRLSPITEHARLAGWRGLLERVAEPEPAAGPAARLRAAEQVLGDILRDFNATAPAEHEAALLRGLAAIGRHLGADRCYQYTCSPDGDWLVSRHQWYAPGVSPQRDDARLPSLTAFPWAMARFADDGAVVLHDLLAADAAGAPEIARWRGQGITSLLLVPLRDRGRVVGVLGCETLGRVRPWGPRDRHVLETMAEICRRVQSHDHTERCLQQANARASDLAALLPEPVAVIDPAGVVVVWNAPLAQLSGLPAAGVQGLPAVAAVDTFLPGHGAWLADHLPRVAAGQSVASNVCEARDGDGQPVWVQLSLRPLTRERQGDAGCLLHCCDLTAAKQEESRIRERNERLEAAVAHQQQELAEAQARLVDSEKMAAVARMVTGLAHEINTPVGVALTAATHLGDRAANLERTYRDGLMSRSDFEGFLDAARESADLIGGNLQRAADLVSGMRQAAVDQAREEVRAVPIKEYLGDILLSLGPRLRERHAEVRLDCPDDLTVATDPGALYRILSNLVMNSLQHGFDGLLVGEIQVTARAHGAGLELVYRDNGRGMAPGDRSRIFEPFFTTARGRGGMGLGLHIVYSLVTGRLGGSIRCESRPGKGARFDILLPCLETERAPEHDAASA